MIDLIILEIISVVSFIYSLIFMFTSFAPINHMIIIFIISILILLVFALNYRKTKLVYPMILLLLLPIALYEGKTVVFFSFTITIFSYIYIMKSLLKGNHNEYVSKLKITYVLYGFLMLIRTTLYEATGSISYALIFIIIYLLSSIILVRIQRHLDSNMDIRKIRKTNIRYFIFIAVGFIIFVFDGVKSYIVDTIQQLIMLMFYPLYWIIGSPKGMEDISIENGIILEDTENISKLLPLEEIGKIGENPGENILINIVDFFMKLTIIAGIILIIYIIYKLLIKIGDREDQEPEYTEEREFIRKTRKTRKILYREKYPIEANQQIRYYYRNYLRKLKKEDIEILKSDTSLEINKKADNIPKDKAGKIRKIYIKVRYGNKDADKSIVEEMENICKNL